MFIVLGMLMASATLVPPASPAPSPSPPPGRITIGGYVRAYDFTRQYATENKPGAVNESSENNALSLHGGYAFSASGFSLGATYLYANPLSGNCSLASQNIAGSRCINTKAPGLNPDGTLPNYIMSTLYEAFVAYANDGLWFKGGNQVINTPWAPSADNRLKPNAFQGIDTGYEIDKNWTVEVSDYWAYEGRTSSAFSASTNLTSYISGCNAITPGSKSAPSNLGGSDCIPGYIYNPGGLSIDNGGFAYGRVAYSASNNATANLYYYSFQNIANAVWFDATENLSSGSAFKPYIAAQAGSETNTGASDLGRIASTVFGLQAGANFSPNVQLVLGFDTMPWKTANVAKLPPGVICSKGQVVGDPVATSYSLPYFLPDTGSSNPTGSCVKNADGSYTLEYGGWASPYSDGYASSNPFYTTMLATSMIDRRSAGSSEIAQLNFVSDDRKLAAYVSHGWFDFGNRIFAQSTFDTDLDVWYKFNDVPKTGPYHGFSLRYRYGERDQAGGYETAGVIYATTPTKFNRFQAEYDF